MTAVESKRPLSDRRKERSREAARSRRSKETELFVQLAEQLPLPESVRCHLDKASVMRLALSYLRTRRLLSAGYPTKHVGDGRQENQLSLQSLEAFLLVITSAGDMIYVTDNISKFMGLSQVDLIGHSIYDFTHPCDHGEIHENLSIRGSSFGLKCGGSLTERDFFLRMKCTVTNRGRTVNLKSANWKVLHCTGHLKLSSYSSTFSAECPALVCAMLLCEPIPQPPGPDTPVGSHMFISQHSLDMRFITCDNRVIKLLGYQPDELSKRSVYDLYHPLDATNMARSHRILCIMGQVVSGPYRLLAKWGGFVWVETQASVRPVSPNNQSHVVCLNTVLSNIEERWVAFSFEQTKAAQKQGCRPVPSRLKQESAALPQATEASLGYFQREPRQFTPLRSGAPSHSYFTIHAHLSSC
ncbi:hypothetical protein AALO_G00220110 [Alosa alosa]|uniref:Uncharacterized protein n=1 Tax=Alosa alosa TaxID=278164 RepID=A0AAV6G1F7_9TELE|nr:endothelial PAS domain-containing protein 1-like [Alosa alosa]KAG5267290.1 hypothetical protein AALO_G00220110 [Alosa alosa]